MLLKSRKIHFYLLALLLCLGANVEAWATHIVGGELYYQYTGSNTYEITLKVYRDCGPDNTNNTQFDEVAYVGVFSDGDLVDVLGLDVFSAEVSTVPVTLENPCFILPPDLCIQEAIYTGEVVLGPDNDGYDFVYQRCCRNGAIQNVAFAGEMGMSLWSHIPGTSEASGNNSAPIFTNFPPVALCMDADFFFDHSATDADGDSLAYRWYTPFHGGGTTTQGPADNPNFVAPNPPTPPPFTELTWVNGFNETNQISSDPNFTLDPITGQIFGHADDLGRFAIGIAVEEYRNDVLINTTYRDFQYLVTICDPNIIAAVPDQEAECDGLSFVFANNSVNAQSYYWDFGDPNSTDDWSTDFSPSYTYQDSGQFTVTLIANPDWPCADTVTNVFGAYPTIDLFLDNFEFECLDGQPTFSFELGGMFDPEVATIAWDFGSDSSPSSSNEAAVENVYFGEAGEHEVEITLEENGCELVVFETVTVDPDPIPIIPPQDIFCNGFTYEFGNDSQNSDSYLWDFGIGNSDQTGEEFPTFTFPGDGVYDISLTAYADFACPQSSSEVIELHPLLDPFFEQQLSQCLDGNEFQFNGVGANTPDAIYSWTFGENGVALPPTATGQSSPNITFSEAGIHDITVTIEENGCQKEYTDDVHIFPNMLPGFLAISPDGCPPHITSFIDTSFAATPLDYSWNLGDGTISEVANPQHTYTSPGTYTVSMTVWTTGGCLEEKTVTKDQLINIFPIPTAGMVVSPLEVSIIEPNIEVFDTSEDATACEYWTTDGGYFTSCDWIYTFTDAGFMEVMQVVTNEFGCTDTVRQVVQVTGFTFYAPNSFTPGSDQINDAWLPLMTGISEYNLEIYNRWGEVIFQTVDPEEPWLGGMKERSDQYFVPNGVYAYQVILKDKLGQPHLFKGSITLMR